MNVPGQVGLCMLWIGKGMSFLVGRCSVLWLLQTVPNGLFQYVAGNYKAIKIPTWPVAGEMCTQVFNLPQRGDGT